MGVRYQKYRSIAIPLNIGIELSQVSRYFDIFGIEPALTYIHIYNCIYIYIYIYINTHTHIYIKHLPYKMTQYSCLCEEMSTDEVNQIKSEVFIEETGTNQTK